MCLARQFHGHNQVGHPGMKTASLVVSSAVRIRLTRQIRTFGGSQVNIKTSSVHVIGRIICHTVDWQFPRRVAELRLEIGEVYPSNGETPFSHSLGALKNQ